MDAARFEVVLLLREFNELRLEVEAGDLGFCFRCELAFDFDEDGDGFASVETGEGAIIVDEAHVVAFTLDVKDEEGGRAFACIRHGDIEAALGFLRIDSDASGGSLADRGEELLLLVVSNELFLECLGSGFADEDHLRHSEALVGGGGDVGAVEANLEFVAAFLDELCWNGVVTNWKRWPDEWIGFVVAFFLRVDRAAADLFAVEENSVFGRKAREVEFEFLTNKAWIKVEGLAVDGLKLATMSTLRCLVVLSWFVDDFRESVVMRYGYLGRIADVFERHVFAERLAVGSLHVGGDGNVVGIPVHDVFPLRRVDRDVEGLFGEAYRNGSAEAAEEETVVSADRAGMALFVEELAVDGDDLDVGGDFDWLVRVVDRVEFWVECFAWMVNKLFEVGEGDDGLTGVLIPVVDWLRIAIPVDVFAVEGRP